MLAGLFKNLAVKAAKSETVRNLAWQAAKNPKVREIAFKVVKSAAQNMRKK